MRKALVFTLSAILAVFVTAPTLHNTLRSTNEDNTISWDIFGMALDESGGISQPIELAPDVINEGTGGGGSGIPSGSCAKPEQVEVARDVIQEGTGGRGHPLDCAKPEPIEIADDVPTIEHPYLDQVHAALKV